jgi:hypothetical protein
MLHFIFGVPEEDIEGASDQQLEEFVRMGGAAARQAKLEKRFRKKLSQMQTKNEALQQELQAVTQELQAVKKELQALKHKWENPVDAQTLERAGEETLCQLEQVGGIPAIQEYFDLVLEREHLTTYTKPCSFAFEATGTVWAFRIPYWLPVGLG